MAGLGEPKLCPGKGGLSGHQVSQTAARGRIGLRRSLVSLARPATTLAAT